MGKVYEESSVFLSGNPAFLVANKNKSIQSSTLKTKFADWIRSAAQLRNSYAMGPDAFDQVQTHPEWIVKMVKIIKMQAVAQVSSFVCFFPFAPMTSAILMNATGTPN